MNSDLNYAKKMSGLVDDFRKKNDHEKKISIVEKFIVQLLEDIKEKAKNGHISLDYMMPLEMQYERKYAEYMVKRLKQDFGFDAHVRPDMDWCTVQICWKPKEKYNVKH